MTEGTWGVPANHWMVVLEAHRGDDAIDVGLVRRLMEAVADICPSSLCGPGRYALQVEVAADGPAEALTAAVDRWRDATRTLGPSGWELVRAEVMTPAEFERECDAEAELEDRPGAGRRHPAPSTPADAAAEELLRQAFADELTGLPGRQAFLAAVAQAVSSPAGEGVPCVLQVALDGIGQPTTAVSPAVGDELLVLAAHRLAGMTRRGDTVARIGGDRFGVLLEDACEGDARAVAERIVDRLRLGHEVVGGRAGATTRVGVGVWRPGLDADVLVGRAGEDMPPAQPGGAARHVAAPARGWRAAERPEPPEKRRLFGLLSRAAAAAAECADLEEGARRVLGDVCQVTGWTAARLAVAGWAGGQSRSIVVSYHAGRGRFEVVRRAIDAVPPSAGPVRPSPQSAVGTPARVSDCGSQTGLPGVGANEISGARTALAFPIRIRDEIVGTFELFADAPAEPGAVLFDAMVSVSDQLARVVERDAARVAVKQCEEGSRPRSDVASHAIVSTDPRGLIVSWNDGASRLFGYAEDEVLGKPIVALVAAGRPDVSDGGASASPPAVLPGTVGQTAEVWGRRRDGTEVPLELSLSAWRVSGDRFFTSVIREVSDGLATAKRCPSAPPVRRLRTPCPVPKRG